MATDMPNEWDDRWATSDPFPGVQKELDEQLESFERQWSALVERIRNEEHLASSVSIAQSLEELQNQLDEMSSTYNDLKDVVHVLEQGSEQFNVSSEQLQERKSYVQNKEKVLNELQQRLTSPLPAVDQRQQQQQQQQHAREDLDESVFAQQSKAYYYDEESENDWAGIQDQNRYQQLLHEEQNSLLDSVGHTIGNLRNQATQMGRELYDHSQYVFSISYSYFANNCTIRWNQLSDSND